MTKTVSAGGVVLNNKGEVLVVSQHGTSWSLPKGHVEGEEDLLQTARREIFEETGIHLVEFLKPLGTYERFRIGQNGSEDESELKEIHLFLFRTDQTEIKPIDSENPEARWVVLEEVSQLLTHPTDKEFFMSILNEISL